MAKDAGMRDATMLELQIDIQSASDTVSRTLNESFRKGVERTRQEMGLSYSYEDTKMAEEITTGKWLKPTFVIGGIVEILGGLAFGLPWWFVPAGILTLCLGIWAYKHR